MREIDDLAPAQDDLLRWVQPGRAREHETRDKDQLDQRHKIADRRDVEERALGRSGPAEPGGSGDESAVERGGVAA